jgi:hypothetical protein
MASKWICSHHTATSKTHGQKIADVPVFYMALELHDFDGGKSITQAIGRGKPWEWICPVSKSLNPLAYKQRSITSKNTVLASKVY